MAFEVKFGKSDKRINSTKIPELTESATCVLKSGTSVENQLLFFKVYRLLIGMLHTVQLLEDTILSMMLHM